jgi:NDP-sugar pyrophosphorylase family protein|tara:strand:- start:3691 stop:4413 length:723 start_codon:yes stop_codon:yes gene_type:complete
MSDFSQVSVIVLAGGLGTRLRGVVPDLPKVIVEINGKPFITYLLDQLVEAKIDRVILCTGYMAQTIEETIGSSYRNLHIDYSREEKPLGTAGALKLAGQVDGTNYHLVMNGDSFTEVDLVSLMVVHKKSDANITILIKTVEDSSRYGKIQINDNNNITEFTEKGSCTGRGFINTGVYMMNTSMLLEIPDKIPCSLEYDFFPSMIRQGLYGYETKEKFIDIGTPESFAKAEAFFERKPVPI